MNKFRLAVCVFVSALPAAAQDFYELHLRAGEAELSSSRPVEAAVDLRIAAFGLLDRPPLLCEALVYLALAEEAAGRTAASESVLLRLAEVSRSFGSCREARLDPGLRSELGVLARRRLPPSVAEELLAAPKSAATARPTAAASAQASVTPRPAGAAPPAASPVPRPPPAPAPPAAQTPVPTALRSEPPRAASSDDLDRQPQLKTTTPPVYPPGAQRAGIGGIVLLSVLVSERGDPIRVEVARGVQPDLDQAAVTAVRRWVFEPGRKGGASVAAWMTVAVPFDASRY